jgi:hypothetical protein
MKIDNLAKVDMSFTVNMYDNGFMVEVNGRDAADDWAVSRTVANTPTEVLELIETILSMPKVD